MRKFFLFAALALVSIYGCNNNQLEPSPEQPSIDEERIPINLSTQILTKATDTNYEKGDQVGIYTVNYLNGVAGTLVDTGNHLDNIRFTYDGAKWASDVPVYWKDQKTPADFYCYYPFRKEISDINAIDFSVQKDQESIEGYKASDLLWGKAENVTPSEKPVEIITRHAFSNVIICLVPGNGYTKETLAAEDISIAITGVKTSAILDMSTGIVRSTGNISNMIPYKDNDRWKALVVPQEIIGKDIIKINVGDDEYILNQTVTFMPNKQHICTLTINRIEEGVNIKIGGWEIDDKDFGGVL